MNKEQTIHHLARLEIMEDCKNCHGTVLYGDEVCPDCGREGN
jgi:uncharacterized OB-fold protein